MPIITHEGSMLDLPSGIFVHGCNAQGVMGSGIALQIKEKYPEAFKEYLKTTSHKSYKTNKAQLLGATPWVELKGGPAIVNAIIQEKYGTDGAKYVDYDAIYKSFRFVKALADARKLPVHFPMIGCGRGGGKWEEIAPIIEKALGPVVGHLWILPKDSNLEINPFFKTEVPN